MTIATNLIKIKGTFDSNKWTEEQLKNYANDKIKNDIDSFYHPGLELFQVKDTSIEIWIYVSGLTSPELLEKNIRNWLKNHIKEDGLTVDSLGIEKSGNGFYVLTP